MGADCSHTGLASAERPGPFRRPSAVGPLSALALFGRSVAESRAWHSLRPPSHPCSCRALGTVVPRDRRVLERWSCLPGPPPSLCLP
eukprot:11460094-Alexandrium_andersonii.AAC.1